jgi:D-tagatose-1,6-bisphosphate aldolase subunit GatZ/KbaZ
MNKSFPAGGDAAGDDALRNLVDRQKSGQPIGMYSVCSSNPFVLAAALKQAKETGEALLIESTSNQVNQYGGYMGMTPRLFEQYLRERTEFYGLGPEQVILGGDHLGPNAWRRDSADSAMHEAAQLVADCVRAGYRKIHLDASMNLGDDPPGELSVDLSARRAAVLCHAAEKAWHDQPQGTPAPQYVIGTEVPVPGGAVGEDETLQVTPVENARYTIEATRQAFQELGVESAWPRVMALVVQPGVEFGDHAIHAYQPKKAAKLSAFIETVPGMVYEAHSTDYQTREALTKMVEDHFAVLKVGPALTFAFREAVFALEWIEQELLQRAGQGERSNLQAILEEEMLAFPVYWEPYYRGSSEEQRFSRRFSLSDRVRYYWNRPPVQAALDRLLANLNGREIPFSLIHQFLPRQAKRIQQGQLAPSALAMIYDKIGEVLEDYRFACAHLEYNQPSGTASLGCRTA